MRCFFYWVYDLAGTASVRNAGRDTLILDGPGMLDATRMLTPAMRDAERRDPSLSPLYGEFTGMPPALLFVGDRDPLLDDTVAMAQRWGEAATAEIHARSGIAPRVHPPADADRREGAQESAWLDR